MCLEHTYTSLFPDVAREAAERVLGGDEVRIPWRGFSMQIHRGQIGSFLAAASDGGLYERKVKFAGYTIALGPVALTCADLSLVNRTDLEALVNSDEEPVAQLGRRR